MLTGMAFDVDRMLRLWLEPFDDPAAAVAAFASVYADPLPVNGGELRVADLVERARVLHATYADVRMELLDLVEAPGRVVVAFRMRGRHDGPMVTPLGTVAPSGREVEQRVIDILTVADGRITGIEMVADTLSPLLQLGAVTLREAVTPR
jgi:ketosteroid isomerase-like protein